MEPTRTLSQELALPMVPCIATTGQPLILHGADRAWLVAHGHVDVFLGHLHEGRPDEALHHVFRAEAGQWLFGFEPSESGWAFCAIGSPQHEVLQTERPGLLSLWSQDVAGLERAEAALGRWVDNLLSGLRVAPASPVGTLESGVHLALAGTRYAPSRKMTWITAESGAMCYFADLNARAAWEPSAGIHLPVPDSAWIEVTEPTTMSVADLACVLQANALPQSLDRFHRAMAACFMSRRDAGDRSELARLQRKQEDESEYMARSIRLLANVMTGANSQAVTGAGAGAGSSLAQAFALLGRHCGFDFKPPAGASASWDGAAEPSASTLAVWAEASGVRTRRVALKGTWWTAATGALLAFREADGAPVVLLSEGARYTVYLPGAEGSVALTPELATQLSPFGYTFHRSIGDAQLKLLQVLRFGSRGLIKTYVLVVAMGLAAGLLGMVIPLFMGMIFDSVIPSSDRGQLAQLTVAMVACTLATAMFELTRGFAIARAEGQMDSSIQAGVWDRLLRLPVPFFRSYSAGDLALRASGINAIRQALSGTTMTALFGAVFSLFNVVLLFYYSVQLALVALALVLMAVFVSTLVSYFSIRQERHLAQLTGDLAGLVFQLLSAISKIRASGAETRAFHLWAGKFKAQQERHYKAEVAHNVLSAFNSVFPVVANIAIFGVVAWLMKADQSLSAGSFMAFNAAFGSLMGAMLAATGALTGALNIVPIYERAKPILETIPEATSGHADPGVISGEIEINQLSFSYTPDGPKILNDLSLRIAPGEFVALVGESGSGKSTLLRLLLGFEKPTGGSIFYDQNDMKGLDLGALRRQLGVVLQNGQLMAGDIFTNIVGSAGALTLDDAWRAAEQAGIADDIRNMPMGMHTVLNDGAGTLSGGQRQRILIARAVVNHPRILFFDEATSALDNKAQAMVSESLEKLRSTRIVIAHRLTTVIHADKIIVLDKGRMVESGTYPELMALNGHFASLANRQIT